MTPLPATRMAAVLTLQVLHDYSDRETAEAVRFDVRWKMAIGASLDDPGFDPSSHGGRASGAGGEHVRFLAAHRAEVFPDADYADLFAPLGVGRPSRSGSLLHAQTRDWVRSSDPNRAFGALGLWLELGDLS